MSDAIAWGKKVSQEFKDKVIEICAGLGCDPSHLMAAMAFETGETFSPSIKNPGSSATGLIQFTKATAIGLGTSTAALSAMTAEQQLDFVEKHFKPFAGKLKMLSDVYMAILLPKAVGRPESFALFQKGDGVYEKNKGLDANKDGVITKAEAANKVHDKLIRGMSTAFVG